MKEEGENVSALGDRKKKENPIISLARSDLHALASKHAASL